MHSRKSFTIGHGRASTRMLTTFLAEFSRYEDSDLDPVAPNAAFECDNVPSIGILEFLNVTGHPTASERSLEDSAYNGMPSHLVACCRQDWRMKDNILIEGRCGGAEIASRQRCREDSLCHSGSSSVVGQVKASARQLLADLSLPYGIRPRRPSTSKNHGPKSESSEARSPAT